jgi:hypothetical protein
MAQDDLSSARGPIAGIDLIAGTIGRFIRGQSTPTPVTVAATGAVGAAVEVAGEGDLRLDLVSTAIGTTLTVTIQTSFDNGATDAWRTVAAFAAQTVPGTVRGSFGPVDRWVRANVTAITGSCTFSLSGEAV